MTTIASSAASLTRNVATGGLQRLGSRPGRLRTIAIVTVITILVAGVIGFLAAGQVISNTNEISDNTGPLLIETQEMFGSLAEADAAATAAHLSSGQRGTGLDRQQRALYEEALARASSSLAAVASLSAEDPISNDRTLSIGETLTRYAGQIEASRVMNEEGIAGADDQLRSAIGLLQNDMSADVAELTNRAQDRLLDQIESPWFWPSMLAYAIAVIVLLLVMAYLAVRFRRIINPPLLLAMVVIAGVAIWFGNAYFTQQAALEDARQGGYESIKLTSEIQREAFRYKAAESLSLIEGTLSGQIPAQRESAGRILANDESGLIGDVVASADSDRERAAAVELGLRWDRYRATSQQVAASYTGDGTASAALASTTGNDQFNGFNTAVSSVLFDNKLQFEQEVEAAGDALTWLRWVVVGGAVLAALLAWWGLALRIREYR